MIMLDSILKVAIFLSIAIIVACQGYTHLERKYVAEAANRIPLLEKGPHSGSLENNDLYLEYQYIRNENQMLISGFVELNGRLKYNFDRVDFFYLTVNFLDSDGLLLKRIRILNVSPLDRIDVKWDFKRKLVSPPETTAIAFGYDGELREKEKDAGGSEPFHLNPLRRIPKS